MDTKELTVEKRLEILERRCYSLTHGKWCEPCELNGLCDYQNTENEGQVLWFNSAYDK